MAQRGEGQAPVARGRACAAGHDAWVQEARGYRCLECRRETSRRNAKKRRRADPARHLWTKAKERAQADLLPFLLTVADVQQAWPQDNRCPVFDIALVIGDRYTTDNSPTLDRLNHDAGYEPGNVAVISMKANRAKQRLTAAELERVAAWMRSRGLD